MSARFIDVPSSALLAALDAIGRAVQERGGSFEHQTAGAEIVFVLRPPKGRAEVRIYTSIEHGSVRARACGKDAIRIVRGRRDEPAKAIRFKPMAPAVRVFRTAPQGTPEARLTAFLDRLRDAVREVYREAVRAAVCPKCSAPMAQRTGANGPFWGCSDYPRCSGTRDIPKTVTSAAAAESPRRPPPARETTSLPMHRAVAVHGFPRGEMAAELVENALENEQHASTFFDFPESRGRRRWW